MNAKKLILRGAVLAVALASLAGCVAYAPAPGYGYAPGYYSAPAGGVYFDYHEHGGRGRHY